MDDFHTGDQQEFQLILKFVYGQNCSKKTSKKNRRQKSGGNS